MNKVQDRLLASGLEIPVSKLCRWLGLPRSTVYYQPRTRAEHRPVDEAMAARISAVVEEALLSRFGWLRGSPPGMALRHDNGLVFGSRRYRALTSEYGIAQEYTAPYTPEQNGLCEQFIRTFKEEHCWIRRFKDLGHAKTSTFIKRYNSERPH